MRAVRQRWSLSAVPQIDGLQIVEAAAGQEAIDKLHEGIDLQQLDYKLLDMDSVTGAPADQET